jgi:hypothetical protein
MKQVERFVKKDQGAMAESSTALVVREDAGAATNVARGTVSSTTSAAKPTKENSLKQVSYWLSEAQPMHKKDQANYDGEFDYQKEIEALPPPPSERSASPMSVQPLKLKQLIPLNLLHEGDDTKSKGTGKVLCAVSSHKQITTQLPTICIKSTGQVMLKSVYEELAKPTMVCPVPLKKFKELDVLELIKAKSRFAVSGEVILKKYNPTLT